jgi:hypothetical protein
VHDKGLTDIGRNVGVIETSTREFCRTVPAQRSHVTSRYLGRPLRTYDGCRAFRYVNSRSVLSEGFEGRNRLVGSLDGAAGYDDAQRSRDGQVATLEFDGRIMRPHDGTTGARQRYVRSALLEFYTASGFDEKSRASAERCRSGRHMLKASIAGEFLTHPISGYPSRDRPFDVLLRRRCGVGLRGASSSGKTGITGLTFDYRLTHVDEIGLPRFDLVRSVARFEASFADGDVDVDAVPRMSNEYLTVGLDAGKAYARHQS